MNYKEKLDFIIRELEITNTNFYKIAQEQILFCSFFNSALDVAKGIEPIEKLDEIKKSLL